MTASSASHLDFVYLRPTANCCQSNWRLLETAFTTDGIYVCERSKREILILFYNIYSDKKFWDFNWNVQPLNVLSPSVFLIKITKQNFILYFESPHTELPGDCIGCCPSRLTDWQTDTSSWPHSVSLGTELGLLYMLKLGGIFKSNNCISLTFYDDSNLNSARQGHYARQFLSVSIKIT